MRNEGRETIMANQINGYDIIGEIATPGDYATRAGRVLIIDRGLNTAHRYVTCWAGNGDISWCWGHYFNDLNAAAKDFGERSERGY